VNYLATSALIKRLVAEPGSELVQKLVTREGPVATAKIAYAEIYAALNRKKREGHLSTRDYRLVCEEFEDDWQAYVRVDLQDEIREDLVSLERVQDLGRIELLMLRLPELVGSPLSIPFALRPRHSEASSKRNLGSSPGLRPPARLRHPERSSHPSAGGHTPGYSTVPA